MKQAVEFELPDFCPGNCECLEPTVQRAVLQGDGGVRFTSQTFGCSNSLRCRRLYARLQICSAGDGQGSKHGRWVLNADGTAFCSECKSVYDYIPYRASYCEVCGARLDEVENG